MRASELSSSLERSFHPGDKLAETVLALPTAFDVEAQAFITAAGHKLLLINKRNRPIDVPIPDSGYAASLIVDAQFGESPARPAAPVFGRLTLPPFAVASELDLRMLDPKLGCTQPIARESHSPNAAHLDDSERIATSALVLHLNAIRRA